MHGEEMLLIWCRLRVMLLWRPMRPIGSKRKCWKALLARQVGLGGFAPGEPHNLGNRDLRIRNYNGVVVDDSLCRQISLISSSNLEIRQRLSVLRCQSAADVVEIDSHSRTVDAHLVENWAGVIQRLPPVSLCQGE